MSGRIQLPSVYGGTRIFKKKKITAKRTPKNLRRAFPTVGATVEIVVAVGRVFTVFSAFGDLWREGNYKNKKQKTSDQIQKVVLKVMDCRLHLQNLSSSPSRPSFRVLNCAATEVFIGFLQG